MNGAAGSPTALFRFYQERRLRAVKRRGLPPFISRRALSFLSNALFQLLFAARQLAISSAVRQQPRQ